MSAVYLVILESLLQICLFKEMQERYGIACLTFGSLNCVFLILNIYIYTYITPYVTFLCGGEKMHRSDVERKKRCISTNQQIYIIPLSLSLCIFGCVRERKRRISHGIWRRKSLLIDEGKTQIYSCCACSIRFKRALKKPFYLEHPFFFFLFSEVNKIYIMNNVVVLCSVVEKEK